MYQFLISVIAFLLAIGILISVHEFGHFWVARRLGVKVLRFSIGFGRPLYRWYDKLGTEFVISAIPLGGYVSLFGERGQVIPPAERQLAFNYKPVWVRMLILVAGPLFNLVFALLSYWVIFMLGTTVLVPILGQVPKDSPAALAGLQAGQEIVSIEGKSTPSWESVLTQLLGHMGEDKTVTITVREGNRTPLLNKTLDLGPLAGGVSESDWVESLGLVFVDPAPPVVGKVLPDHPAFKAGIQEGDRMLSVDGNLVASRSEVTHYIQLHPQKEIHIELLRHNQKMKVRVEPMVKLAEESDKKIGFIGVEFPPLEKIPDNLVRVQRFGVVESLAKALNRTVEYSVLTLEVLKKMIVGKISVRHISGPLVIAKYAGETAIVGIKQFLDFLAVISISLGVLNLLPIPVLDGGHFIYCVYELVTGRSVSEIAQIVGAWIGGIILVGFMILAFYNDLTHLLR